MGYCIDVECSLKISTKHTAKIKQIFKELDMRPDGFRWVNKGFSKLPTVKEMFDEWRYEVTEEDGYYNVESFSGQKIGSCDALWKALESVVEPDSELKYTGEDGAHWKYTFKNNKFKEVNGHVSYEDEPKPVKNYKTEVNAYAVLGVKTTASKKEIELAFKERMKKYHPDKFESMDAEFVELAKAKAQELNWAKTTALSKLK